MERGLNMEKGTVRLNVQALEKEQDNFELASDTQLAATIGVSVTQLWRAKLPIEDPRHNSPGPAFIAGVINAFGGPFEKYFFLDKIVR
jgi:ABC-type thiamine transport system substrate-binding protein